MTDLSTIVSGPMAVKIGALLGALASMSFTATRLRILPALLSIVVGVISSIYMTQVVLYFYPHTKEIQEPISFLCGLFAMNALGGLFVKFARFRKEGDLKEFSDVKVIKDILK